MALASPGYRLGFPQYLAPEQVEGRPADARTDVYALGVLIFELLTATPLFAAPTVAEVMRDVKLAPPPSAHGLNGALPAAVDGVLRRALAKDPAARPASAWALLDELIGLPAPPP
jgi:serine/threonine protein kinase